MSETLWIWLAATRPRWLYRKCWPPRNRHLPKLTTLSFSSEILVWVLHTGLLAAPCRQNHLSADGKEVFLQLMNCSISYALISSQSLMKVLKESKFCIGKNLSWRRWQLFCPWHRSCPWMFFVSLSISLLPDKWGPIFCVLYCWFLGTNVHFQQRKA